MIDVIFEIADLAELREYLSYRQDKDELRRQLYSAFLKHSQYRNAREWNAAVRICEALAIVGWGEHEPLEAIRGVYFNGNPSTYFINRYAKPRYFDAVWSKRKDGFAIDYELSFWHGSSDEPLAEPIRLPDHPCQVQDTQLRSQRNWIPKNPIRIVRGLANCYESSKPLINSIETRLIPELNRAMRPELYGTDIDTIIINISFSFYDNDHCKTNYIIADESLKLKKKDFYPKLLERYSEKEIDDNGYYLRNRFTYGPFRTDTGTARVAIVFEKEFSQLTVQAQKHTFATYLIQAVEQVSKRLERKISYNFPLMLSDLKSILDFWLNDKETARP
ncbi:MAG: hypothetical protein NC418_05640 [Muribaculaceae bacterium]|nr:hypothetical protein [Muribaculaceae bacterium]